MIISEKLSRYKNIFIDTAPFIYFIEGIDKYSHITKEIFEQIETNKIRSITSVITITEVLPRPIQENKIDLAEKFLFYFKFGKNLTLLDISAEIAELAGHLRGKYRFLRSIDSLQIASALNSKSDIFITNDIKLSQFKEIEILILNDYI